MRHIFFWFVSAWPLCRRVKQYSAMPYFEAGTEVFVRNWENCVVRIVVRDSRSELADETASGSLYNLTRAYLGVLLRLREADPILGIVDLPLKHVLAEGSEITRMYSMQEGVGFG